MSDWKHEFVEASVIRIHYVTAGEGPLLLLLHGFPEFWYAWRKQIPALAKHFKVVAPDLRGYGQTDRPEKVSDYQTDALVGDVVGLIHALGYEKAHIVGHDWGGGVAWRTAITQPQVVDRLAVLNCPHPYLFAKALRSNLEQIKKSWYIFFFQLPYLPELLFKMRSKKIIKELFGDPSVAEGTFTREDIETYLEAMEKPGAFTAALNYYRATFRQKLSKEKSEEHPQKISAPTLLIWGEKDRALGKELTYEMDPLFSGPFRIAYIPTGSHWINEEQPEIVNALLLDFLKG